MALNQSKTSANAAPGAASTLNANATPAATEQSTSSPAQPRDGKSWTEFASLQKVVNQVPQGVRDLYTNSMNQVNKLSTTQKVAGAAALVGLGYLAMRSGKVNPQAMYRNALTTYRGAMNNISGSSATPASGMSDASAAGITNARRDAGSIL